MSTWIFLRGLTRESRHWGDFPAVFRAAVGDAEVAAPDLPGNGQRNDLPSPASVEAMAESCRADLLARGMRPPYYLLAMSLGAMVAVAWAHRHPQELRGAVLINTSLRPFDRLHERLRPASYPALLKLAVLGGSADAWERSIFRLTSRCRDDAAEIVAHWSAWRRERPVSRANALRQLVAAMRYRAPAQKPAVPLLVLAGARDALVDPRCSQRLAQRWQAAFAMHPAAGHDLPLDDGAWVAGEVRHWLQLIAGKGD
ncbi:MAG: alpha/beta hydrolase [Rhodocyclaceae bacterium]|nr:alpha/beta hydrolase [Rhodocyclaceae bacterium]